MDIDFSFVCDYGEVSGSRLAAFGIGFDAIQATGLPFWAGQFFFVAQLRFGSHETGDKNLTLRLDDERENVLAEINVPVYAQWPYPGEKSIVRIAVALSNVVFREYGSYHLRLMDGRQEISNVPIRVKPAPTFPA